MKKFILTFAMVTMLSSPLHAIEKCGHVKGMSYGTHWQGQLFQDKIGKTTRVDLQEGGYIVVNHPQGVQLAIVAMTTGALFCEAFELKSGQQYIDEGTNIVYSVKK